MNNTMPMLTDSEREGLIEVARNELKYWDDGGHYKELVKIALAALTAKPVGTIRIEMDWNSHRNVATLDMRADLVVADMANGDSLYTAPPVPALNLPDEVIESDSPVWYRADNATSWANGFNAALDKIKALNGVKP